MRAQQRDIPSGRTPRGEQSRPGSAIEQRYRSNLARHLIAIARDLQERVMLELRDTCGFEGLRPSYGPLVTLARRGGRTLSALAEDLAVSNQACGQLCTAAEAAGYLERQPNPADGRSKLIVLTRRGHELVHEGARIVLEVEADYASRVGAAAYRRFTGSLAALYRGLDDPVHSDLTELAGRSIGVLPMVTVRIEQILMAATTERGHGGLKMSHGQILPLVGQGGARIHEIAKVHGVTRQAISAVARDLEELGYVKSRPDPDDRRSVLLTLDVRGERLIADSVAALDDLDASLRAVIGESKLAQLERVANHLFESLGLEREIFESPSLEREGREARDSERKAGASANDREIQRLARDLHRRLGARDSARLAAELSQLERRSTRPPS